MREQNHLHCSKTIDVFLPDPSSMRPITIKIASAINFPKVKESWIRVAHFTLAQFINMVSARIKTEVAIRKAFSKRE